MAKTDSEGFMTEMPPVPEDEFCVYGTVNLTLLGYKDVVVVHGSNFIPHRFMRTPNMLML
jgi:hypothetical protein